MQTRSGPHLLSKLIPFSRIHRKSPTPSEAILWNALRHKRLGVRFRRQHVLAPYIVDFYCPTYRLVIEIDGSIHDHPEHQSNDLARENELVLLHHVRVVRIRAALVERDLNAALLLILRAMK